MERRQEPTGLAVIGQAFQVMFSQPQLAVMMFLQYAIWGAWAVALAGYVDAHLKFDAVQKSWLYAAMPLANLVVPFTAGQVADRWLPTQIALALFHFIGTILLGLLAFQREFVPMMVLLLAYCVVFAPTLALTNSLAFRNLKDPARDFGPIRMWGTIGWIVANLVLSAMRLLLGTEEMSFIDLFLLAAILSLGQAILSPFLPPTPPARESADPLAFRRAFILLKDKNYLVFFIIAFIVATELQLYYILTNPYLQKIGPVVGITSETAPAWQTVAQVAEIFVIAFLLPYALPTWGIRNTMLVGILAWPIRYFVFSATWYTYQQVPAMVWATVASLALHGFCYVFFFVVAFIYTDRVAPADIKASAQALINVAVLGVGLLIGSRFTGFLESLFKVGDTTNYGAVFLVPALITVLCAVFFWLFFRESDRNVAARA